MELEDVASEMVEVWFVWYWGSDCHSKDADRGWGSESNLETVSCLLRKRRTRDPRRKNIFLCCVLSAILLGSWYMRELRHCRQCATAALRVHRDKAFDT